MDKKITIIGSSVIDVLAYPVDPSVFEIGSLKVEKTHLSFGGNGLNESSAIAKLGKKVDFVSLVGNDEAGKKILSYLKDLGIETNHVVIKDNLETSVNIVLVDKKGERHFITNAQSSLRKQSLNDILPFVDSMGDIVCFSSLFVSPMLSLSDMEILFKEIKKKDRILCVDMTKAKNKETLNDIKPLLKYVDYILPNEEEIELITGLKDAKMSAKLFIDAGCGCCIVKLGKDGCYIKSREEDIMIPSYKVEKVVDTTGAGDSFVGGFIYAISNGETIKNAAKFASSTASCSIECLGATDGIKSLSEVIKRYNTFD